mmetsp:Transcript_9665/g.36307  ORF Transcript_9665/g.36307 Transcript_9665/m.36307 type:complete len:201 (+) Transcript_9665:329-931(+)
MEGPGSLGGGASLVAISRGETLGRLRLPSLGSLAGPHGSLNWSLIVLSQSRDLAYSSAMAPSSSFGRAVLTAFVSPRLDLALASTASAPPGCTVSPAKSMSLCAFSSSHAFSLELLFSLSAAGESASSRSSFLNFPSSSPPPPPPSSPPSSPPCPPRRSRGSHSPSRRGSESPPRAPRSPRTAASSAHPACSVPSLQGLP